MSDGNLARFASDEKRHGRGMSMVFWKEMGALPFSQNRRGALRERRVEEEAQRGPVNDKIEDFRMWEESFKEVWEHAERRTAKATTS